MAKQPDPIVQLALDVQLSIAKLEPLEKTFDLVAQLCERLTGIKHPFNLHERRQALQEKRQKEVTAATETHQKKKPGRPKGTAKVEKEAKEHKAIRNARIRQRHKQGESPKDLSISTGLSATTISNIINAKRGQP